MQYIPDRRYIKYIADLHRRYIIIDFIGGYIPDS